MFGRDLDGRKASYVSTLHQNSHNKRRISRASSILSVSEIRIRSYGGCTVLYQNRLHHYPLFRRPNSYGRAVVLHTADRTEDFHQVYHNIALASPTLNPYSIPKSVHLIFAS